MPKMTLLFERARPDTCATVGYRPIPLLHRQTTQIQFPQTATQRPVATPSSVFDTTRRRRRVGPPLPSPAALRQIQREGDLILTAGDPGLHEMEERPEKRKPLASLTDELLVEILRRVPVRSLCRFQCVSRSWRCLISDPVHRKKLPHTLVGFFYKSWDFERCPRYAHHFTNITGKGLPFILPDFSFLPVPSDKVELEDYCNGLLLCRCLVPGPREDHEHPPFHYAVCNPATKKWVMLPDGSWASGKARTARLGFDPAVSSHFHVFEYVVDDEDCVTGVEIYSSRTGAWSFKESEWGNDVMLCDSSRSVFLNGLMHMLTVAAGIVMVDVEGKTWRSIPVPSEGDIDGCIDQTQGRLFFLNADEDDASKLSIWILEDHGTHEWTLKHSVRKLFLFRQKNLRYYWDYKVIKVHPECNLIYFVYGQHATVVAYEMDRKEVRVIRNLGREGCTMSISSFLPYVPLFSEALADEQ